MISFILYGLCFILLIVSTLKNKTKTMLALKKAFKSWEAIMPQFLFIITLVAVILCIINPSTISSLIGPDSNLFGITLSSIVGSITMMPTFVAFSTGDSLLKSGAGYAQVAALISTLTMVSVLTFSLEAKYIGKKAAFFRNFFGFLFSFLVAFIIGGILT